MPSTVLSSIIGPVPGAPVERPLWVYPQDLVGCVPCDTPINLMDVCQATTQNLYLMSGRQYKQRLVSIRPTPRIHVRSGWWAGYTGEWMQAPANWGGWGMEAAVEPGLFDLRLTGPVQEVVSVKVDGVLLNPGDVELFDGRYLVRMAGGKRSGWPLEQALDLPDTEVGTYSVRYVWGKPVPTGGHVAAHAWACDLAAHLHALASTDDCDLPDKVTQLTRQGVTLSRLNVADFLREGRVGISVVDTWLSAVNPNGLRRPATIASPDNTRGVSTR